MKGGTYPAQQIPSRSIGTTPVVVQPAPGETVTVSESILISTHNLILEGGGTVGVNEPNRILIQGEPAPANESALDFGRGNNSPGVNGVIVRTYTPATPTSMTTPITTRSGSARSAPPTTPDTATSAPTCS